MLRTPRPGLGIALGMYPPVKQRKPESFGELLSVCDSSVVTLDPAPPDNDWITARVDELIKVDRRVKLKEIFLKLDIPKTNVYEIVHDKLGYRKVSARWVPKMLSDDHKHQRVEISQILLHWCQQEGDETVDVGPGGDHRAKNKLL
ncbi:histone-lysine N-methyltransferase SETMAR [Plakobranchus ocellatus]|uniref:Histone-lysine N-methyltransferase SETMAR n=1 Tax=Plakobranchus ocellatus TaxID=259542 RepID=A0AAV4AX62_9GAST|nr:histone-lysine N-methyltransferase SETMAR [Plakobranchus ocellatus]